MENNVVLIGYMGCGKSSVGRKLAVKKRMDFMDLDDYIESKEQQSIKTIFKEKGEVYFRKIEAKYLKECLESHSNAVISLGGGTPCFGDNMECVLSVPNTISIYLKTSITELSERLFDQRVKRPLIAHVKDKEELTEFIAKHVFERLNFYSKAKFTVQTDRKTLTDVVNEIENLIRN